MKENTEISRALREACQELSEGFNKIIEGSGRVSFAEAMYFRACTDKALQLFDEWKEFDKERVMRELRVKYFACALVKHRFTTLVEGSVRVPSLLLFCYYCSDTLLTFTNSPCTTSSQKSA